MEKDEFALETFKNIQEIIRFIDQKASLLLVITGAIIPVFIECSKELSIIRTHNIVESLTFLAGLVLVSLVIFEIYFIVFKIINIRAASHYKPNELSVFYFGHIITDTRYVYQNKFKQLPDNKIEKEITAQIYEVSNILDNKVKNIRIASYFLVGEIIALLIFILLTKLI